MFKKIATILDPTLFGTVLFVKVKEKRSYKSFLQERMTRISGTKKTFESINDAKKALNKTKYQTAGKYNETTYEFKHKVQIRDYYGSLVYIINDRGLSDQRAVLYVYGDTWFQDPLKNRFEYLDLLADAPDARVIMPVYLKVPHRDYRTTFELLTKIYKRLLTKIDEPENLVIIGDLAGGQIALVFTQMLKKEQLSQPGHIVLISPVLDVTFKNPESRKYEKEDPVLDIDSSKYLVELWAGDTPLDDYKMSSMNGDLKDLGHITLTVGTKEISYPDTVKFSHMLNDKGIKHQFIPGHNLFHICPLFPIPEHQRFLEQFKKVIVAKEL